ncbi:MAG: hypothetical protein R3F14_37240 [Polyangiaceae bacterium]
MTLAGAAFGALGLTGCFSQCAALCVGSVTASGKVDVPAEKPALDVTLCVNAACSEGQLTFEASGTASCDGDLKCELTEDAAGATLEVQSFGGVDDVEAGDEIHVTVKVADTGAVLVDSKQIAVDISESELCGSKCHSAEVSWDQ